MNLELQDWMQPVLAGLVSMNLLAILLWLATRGTRVVLAWSRNRSPEVRADRIANSALARGVASIRSTSRRAASAAAAAPTYAARRTVGTRVGEARLAQDLERWRRARGAAA